MSALLTLISAFLLGIALTIGFFSKMGRLYITRNPAILPGQQLDVPGIGVVRVVSAGDSGLTYEYEEDFRRVRYVEKGIPHETIEAGVLTTQSHFMTWIQFHFSGATLVTTPRIAGSEISELLDNDVLSSIIEAEVSDKFGPAVEGLVDKQMERALIKMISDRL